MNTKFTTAFVAAVVLLARANSVCASTFNQPTVDFTIGDARYDFSPLALESGSGGDRIWKISGVNLEGEGWSLVGFNATMDSDPMLVSSGTFTNTTGHDIPFSLGFFLSLPAATYNTPASTLVITVNNSIPGAASATANMANTVNGGTATGADINGALCSVTDIIGSVSNTCSFTGSGGFNGLASSMETGLSGNLGPNGTYAISGTFSLEAQAEAPESRTFILFGIGLGLIGLSWTASCIKRQRTGQ